jgi:putative ABC transport system permease protein
MFLAFREMRHAKLRFALITLVIVMVSSLVFIIAALANGLSEGNTAAIEALPADRIVVSSGSDYLLDRSAVSAADAKTIAGLEGIDAAEPIGIASGNVRISGHDSLSGISFFGIEPNGMVQPKIKHGQGIGDTANGAVIDQTLADDGVGVGDTITVEPGGAELSVVGITEHQTYRIAPVVFIPLALYQQLYPAQAGEPGDAVTAILVDGNDAGFAAIPDTVPDVTVATRQEVSNHIPGESEQNSTLLLIQIFLVVIAAGIIAAFFYILTLQKMPELGVMKAIGAGTGTIARSLVAQAVTLAVIGVLLGIPIADTLELVIGGAVPYSISASRMALFGSFLLVVAVGGTLLSLWRIARVDPLDAIAAPG